MMSVKAKRLGANDRSNDDTTASLPIFNSMTKSSPKPIRTTNHLQTPPVMLAPLRRPRAFLIVPQDHVYYTSTGEVRLRRTGQSGAASHTEHGVHSELEQDGGVRSVVSKSETFQRSCIFLDHVLVLSGGR